MPSVIYIGSPAQLPFLSQGRVALVDVAFAHGKGYELATRPFLEELGERLALWVDHHDHPAWHLVAGDPRFVLVDRRRAPACPQLITPELVAGAGKVDTVVAHLDFDGVISACKFLLGGRSPYAAADEDARAVDTPGRGYELSGAGARLAGALSHGRDTLDTSPHRRFLAEVTEALRQGSEPAYLRRQIDDLAAGYRQDQELATRIAMQAGFPHPQIAWLRVGQRYPDGVRKAVLRRLQDEHRVAVMEEGDSFTVATYDDEIDLSFLPGVRGGRTYVWGYADGKKLLAKLVLLLRKMP